MNFAVLQEEKLKILKHIPLFKNADNNLLLSISKILKEEKCPTDTTIFKKGDIGTKFYIFSDGYVDQFGGEKVTDN